MEWEIVNQVGKYITLLTLEQFNKLSPEQMLINIFGEQKQKRDAYDDDRGGYVAYGLPESFRDVT